MLKLTKPSEKDEEKYREMITEWAEYGGAYVPCIIDYDCNHLEEGLDYNATLKVINDYSKGKIFDYDVDYFKSSDFLFIFDEDELIGMGEVRHNLQKLGEETIGHLACGIRPSKRKQGYASRSIELMLEELKKSGVEKAIICHYAENNITPKIAEKLGFVYRNSVVSEVSKKEIKCHVKKLWYLVLKVGGLLYDYRL